MAQEEEVPDLSRTFLSSFAFIVGVLVVTRLVKFAVDPSYSPYHELISPFLVLGGLCAITLFLIYPIEVIRPRLLRGWRFVLPFVPVILLSIPSLVGMKYQTLLSTDDLMEHLLEFNVLLRLLGVVIVLLISLSLMAIPYNWRETSVNHRWILRTVMIAQVISVLFFVQGFTSSAVAQLIHLLWLCISLFYFTYFELRERLLPVELPSGIGGRSNSTVPQGRPVAADILSDGHQGILARPRHIGRDHQQDLRHEPHLRGPQHQGAHRHEFQRLHEQSPRGIHGHHAAPELGDQSKDPLLRRWFPQLSHSPP